MQDFLSLLPEVRGLQVRALQITRHEKQVLVFLEMVTPQAPCPLCGVVAVRIHSRYQRTLTDLPWAKYVVQLQVRVRKFYCDNAQCACQIFCERLPTLATPRL